LNPLHADPAFAESVGFAQGPILHGLCTYGFLARAAIGRGCGGDASRIRAFCAQFKRPVWPGETLITHGFDVGEGEIVLRTHTADRPDTTVTNCWAELSS
jgi:acyl dehydratase